MQQTNPHSRFSYAQEFNQKDQLFRLVLVAMWIIPFIVIGIDYQMQVDFNFHGLKFADARGIAAFTHLLTLLELIGYVFIAQRDGIAALPFSILFSWNALSLVYPANSRALFWIPVLFGLGPAKMRLMTSIVIALPCIYILYFLFYAQVILGQFDVAILEN
jgi:hypothetical protein